MGIEGYITLGVIALMTAGLALEIAGADFLLFAALSALIFTGIISPGEALAGFSNQGMLTVAVLFVISRAVQNTGALNNIARFFLSNKSEKGVSRLMLKMMLPVTFLSAFLNNTPIVVIFTQMVKKWAERLHLSPSKFLIPLSYAAIFGGVCTLIGTSTNLVVHGLMLENGMAGISMFELARIGVPCALIGWLYMAFIGKKLLPERKHLLEVVGANRKEYVVEMNVQKGCEFAGKTIKEAGLRNLKGLFLLEIERNGESIGPVSSEEKVHKGDRLMFVGITSAIVELQEISGLVPVARELFEKDFAAMQPHLIEAVVSSSSPVLGKTVKECKFRLHYGAGVIAVHRNGERIRSKIGSIRLKTGDTLLLLAGKEFLDNWKNSQDFYLISDVKSVKPRSKRKSYIAMTIVGLMVLVATIGRYLPEIGGQRIGMLHAVLAAAILMVLTRCVRFSEARQSLRLDILIIIACAFGISKALQNSGAAGAIAGFMINTVKSLGPIGVLAGIYLITTVFTEIITNNAAAALIFPIAFSAASQLGVSPRPLFIAIAIAASASFATPIGYQTNLIVQGAGGYKFSDYFKVGLPLNILFFIASMIIIPLFWSF